ncbi:RNase A-like domain-containing protein, partial [Gilliamella sp. wkB171]|uniref:RNase A-like domain-containing protein n=1 Tax=Gilliamella sp. wkB171 TaxID=3120258 RepID=UPI000ABD5BC7
GAAVSERGAEVIASILYPNKSIDELTQDEKQQVSALAQLATGLAIAALGGDAQDINTAIAGGKNAVENNLLSNKRGVEKLDKDGKKLHEKIKNIVGVDEVDKLEEKYNECKTDECRKDVYNEYIQKEQEAGKKLYELYQSGNLSADEYFQLVSSYASSMLEGIQEGQTDNAKNHRFMDWDIYDASGSDWIPSNIISNPYLSGVRGLILLKQWRAEGLSESQIQERFLKDNILGAFGSGPDINEIVHQVRNGGLSVDDALRLATLTVYGKVTDNASKGKNVTGKETDANKPLDKTDLELQHGKGNVEQGGGNYKENKDKILDNQDTNQKANESSNFGEHVKKEQEINAGKGNGAHSPIVPGGGLAAHEAAGGDLIARHVGKTEAELLNRVSTGNVKTASSFTDRATAEAITSKAIDANQSKINDYLSGSQKGYLEIDYKSSSTIGISVSKGQTSATQVSNARIIIARDPSMPTGYRIITGYPTP